MRRHQSCKDEGKESSMQRSRKELDPREEYAWYVWGTKDEGVEIIESEGMWQEMG